METARLIICSSLEKSRIASGMPVDVRNDLNYDEALVDWAENPKKNYLDLSLFVNILSP